MEMQVVLCPNKKCRHHKFATTKEEAQCWKCKKRFNSLENLLDSKKPHRAIIIKQSDNRFKKIEGLLEKLSSKHEETGVAIKEIRNMARD